MRRVLRTERTCIPYTSGSRNADSATRLRVLLWFRLARVHGSLLLPCTQVSWRNGLVMLALVKALVVAFSVGTMEVVAVEVVKVMAGFGMGAAGRERAVVAIARVE